MPDIYVVQPPGPSEVVGFQIPLAVKFYTIELGIQGTTGVPVWPENYQEQFRIGEPLPDPPEAAAGPDQSVHGGASLVVTLAGSETHHTPTVTIEWTKVSGPGTVTFDDDTDPTTTVTFSASGTYVLRLTVDDGRNAAVTDDVSITVTMATWKKLAFAADSEIRPVRVVTISTTELTTDGVIVCNKTTAMTVTLLAATGSGRTRTIKNINTGEVTIDAAGAETIDDELTQHLNQWESVDLVDYASGKWMIS